MRKHLSLLALALSAWLPAGDLIGQTFKINAGGPAVAPFTTDSNFTGGSNTFVTSATITGNGSYPMSIYQTERSGDFDYTLTGFPANAPCEVRLHFAEIYWTETGKRVFNVEINDEAVLNNYDIVAKVGNKNIATTETFLIYADEAGEIYIDFTATVDNAKVSAIEAKSLFAGDYTAQPKIQSGTGSAGAISPFLNGKLPALNPTQTSGSGGWDVVNAFPGLVGELPNIMNIYAVPLTTPQKLVARLRGGQMKVFDENPAVTSTFTLMDISDRLSFNNNGGLSAFCFHPEFNVPGSPNKDYVYVYYQTIQGEVMYNRLSRFTRNPSTGTVDNNTELVMLQMKELPPLDHTGGGMIFDNDGFLILMIGDLEWTDEEYTECLTLDTMFQSSILRIDVDMNPARSFPATRTLQGGIVNGIQTVKSHTSGRYADPANFSGIGYFIPNDNPYNNDPTALKEHYGKGVRNPWNITKDSVSGDILFFDAGSNMGDKYEEVNLLKPKGDYGWPYWEGPISKTFETGIAAPVPVMHNSPTPILTPLGTFTEDVASYNHTNGNGNAMGDGDVYQGDSLPGLKGKLIYCDFTSGRIWAKDYTQPLSAASILMDGDGGISGIKSSPDKENLYIVNYNNGAIYKMVSVGVPNPQPPALLSQTGAFTDLATLAPTPGLIPYEPASPLWSDNSSKHRWMAIPNDGTHNTPSEKINFSENSEWEFPVGSVFVKHFELPTNEATPNIVVRLETRFLVHGPDGYFAFSYKWNDEGTEAFLQNDASTATIPVTQTGGSVSTQVWQFPSQSACMDCHQLAAGRVLGAKTHSLNWPYPYVSAGTQNQLTYLDSHGIFDQPLIPTELANYITAKNLTDTSASVETRVRSFLDMNCSNCHRPGGVAGRAVFDARLTTPLALAGLVDADPSADTLGLPNPKLIKPGDAANSIISVRDSIRNSPFQMPPLGTTIPHPGYVSLLNTWINSLTSSGDSDGDGVPDAQDAFPSDPTEWADTDGDGVGNNADAFPSDPTEWADSNGDGVGDNTVLGPLQTIIARNSGGGAAGPFTADASFIGGGTYTSTLPIGGKPDGIPDAVYQSERNKNFTYIASGLDPASYHRVELHFAEIFWTESGKRLFDVTLNGNLILDDFDVFVAAGGAHQALVKAFVIKPDSTGTISLQFTSIVDEAKLSAISIAKHLGNAPGDSDGDGVPDLEDAFPNDPLEWADGNGDGVGDNTVLGPLQPLLALNAGGSTTGGFAADSNFTGGGTYSTSAPITNVPVGVPAAVYQTERNFNFSYNFAGLDPAAFHRIELHFAEIFWTEPGKRIFDVAINGQTILNDFDIFAEAGATNKALVKAIVVKPNPAGAITLQFTAVVDQAKLSALTIGKHLATVPNDSDGDGYADTLDAFPNDPTEWLDTDGDLVGDNSDAFPDDPTEWADTNGDGVGDNTVLGPLQPLLALNAGGAATGTFAADSGFTGGGTYPTSAPITNVPVGVPAAVYQTERNFNFSYNFPGLDPAAFHRIELHFAEIFWTEPGKRIFDVAINGQTVLNDFDIFAEAGAINKALTKAFVVKPNTAGAITLQFTAVVDQAKLSALTIGKHLITVPNDSDGDGYADTSDAFPNDPTEWLDTDGDLVGDNSDVFPDDPNEWADTNGDGVGDNTVLGPLQPLLALNAGGAATGGFATDTYFTGGGTYSTSAPITNVPVGIPAAVYQTERNVNFSYNFAGLDPVAFHRIELHFAEIFWTEPGKRIFDVAINGQTVLNDFDIFAEAGATNKALVKALVVKPTPAGSITLQFTTVVDQAKLSALTIGKHLPASPPPPAPAAPADSDGDGVLDPEDAFPNDPYESLDSDGDGSGDNTDLFPADPTSNGAGTYTLLLPVPSTVTSIGDGYGTLSLDGNLTGELTLNMGDGTQFVQSVTVINGTLTVNASGTAPQTADTLQGSLSWTPQAGVSDFNGTLQWAIAGQSAPISIVAMGSLYTPGPLETQLGQANVTVDLLGNPTDVQQGAAISGNGITWTLSPAMGTFDQATGVLTWQVTDAAGKPLTIEAVYFDDQNLVGGFFHDGLSEIGVVQIAPQ